MRLLPTALRHVLGRASGGGANGFPDAMPTQRPRAQPCPHWLYGRGGMLPGSLVAGTTAMAGAFAVRSIPIAVAVTLPAGVGSLLLVATVAGSMVGIWAAKALGHGPALRTAWASYAPHVAIGLSVAPLLAVGAMAFAGPGALATLGCAVGLMVVIARARAASTPPSMTACVASITACAVLGPTGWLIAAGVTAGAVVGQAVGTAGVLLSLCALAYGGLRTVIESAPTDFADAAQVLDADVAQWRLDGISPTKERANIFGLPEPIEKLTRELQDLKKKDGAYFNGWSGLPVVTLYGPPGGGKSVSAKGMAEALGAGLVEVDDARLRPDKVDALPEAAMNLVTLLMESQLKAAQENRPYVVFVDEVDAFLPHVNAPAGHETFTRALGFVLVLSTLAMLARSKTNLVVLMATNLPEKIKPALDLLSRREPMRMGTPSHEDLGRMVHYLLYAVKKELAERDIACTDLEAHSAVPGFIDRLFTLGRTGRSLGLLDYTSVRAAALAQHEGKVAGDPQAVTDTVFAALEAAIAKLEAQGSAQKDNDAYGELPKGGESLPLERALRDIGLTRFDPLEATRRIFEYLDPGKSTSLGVLWTRFSMTMFQVAIAASSQWLSPKDRLHFKDVPDDILQSMAKRAQVSRYLGSSTKDADAAPTLKGARARAHAPLADADSGTDSDSDDERPATPRSAA